MEVVPAQAEYLESLAALFDLYRVFYQQVSDLDGAKLFLAERLQACDSQIFVAIATDKPIGFTQLYPSFSSVSMQKIWILNDLYVIESYRGRGVAHALMKTAERYARDTGAVRVTLSTQLSNAKAQTLYEARGYVRDSEFSHYALEL
ncbi:MAG: GNAT family N-acetyltransferase [Cyanobacteria bacterium J06642_2]